MAREINLVPDIKNEMIKALKMRNLIFFLSIVIAAASVGATLLVGSVMGGQQLALSGKQSTLEKLSKKLNSYGDLSEFLTFQGQIDNIEGLIEKEKVVSRTFDILSAIIPSGPDLIEISDLNVRFENNAAIFRISAKADARKEPYIDYNVLDSFKKSMQYTRYDYGRYVDKNGNTIPAYCIIEKGADGATFSDAGKGIYAYWDFNIDGCMAQSEDDAEDNTEDNTEDNIENNNESKKAPSGYTTEYYNDKEVIRIWRTPQYAEWYSSTETEGKPYMSLNGEIKNVAHFESSCITYTGTLVGDSPKWSETNESCLLVPDGTNGIKILSSANARNNSTNELVLNFDAQITINSDAYLFTKKHLLAIAPSGRHNVTDSYVQIQSMFGERATECSEDDSLCQSNTENVTGDENSAGDEYVAGEEE